MWGSLTANRRERAAESRRRSGRNALRLVHTPNPIHWARPSIRVSSARVNVTEGMAMLDSEFQKQRAQLARELAEVAKDRFIKQRLLDLAARYEDNRPPTAITPVAIAQSCSVQALFGITASARSGRSDAPKRPHDLSTLSRASHEAWYTTTECSLAGGPARDTKEVCASPVHTL